MVCKLRKSIYIIFIIVLLLTNIVFPHMFPADDYRAALFDNFTASISRGMVNINDPQFALNLNGRKNLLVGCSPVAYCARYGGSDLLARYDYDTIGFGSTNDADIAIWMGELKRNDYDKIVMWGTANDIMFFLQNDLTSLNDTYKAILDVVANSLMAHIKEGGKLIYIKPKPMLIETDLVSRDGVLMVGHPMLIEAYNLLANEVSEYMRQKGLICIDINYPTTSENSEWYIHYTNKEIFEDLLKRIDAI